MESAVKQVRERGWKDVARELAECHDSHRLGHLTRELLEALEPGKMREVENRVARELGA